MFFTDRRQESSMRHGKIGVYVEIPDADHPGPRREVIVDAQLNIAIDAVANQKPDIDHHNTLRMRGSSFAERAKCTMELAVGRRK
jgi:hypothetical protein